MHAANKSTCCTRAQARELVRQAAEDRCSRSSVSVPRVLILSRLDPVVSLVYPRISEPLVLIGPAVNAVVMSTRRRTRASSVPPANSLGSGTPMGPGVLPRTSTPSTQLPVVPPPTSATTVLTPPAPLSSSSPPLTWEAVLGAITAAGQAQASESSGSLPSSHVPLADSITAGKSDHFFTHIQTQCFTISLTFPLNGTACLSVRGSSGVNHKPLGLSNNMILLYIMISYGHVNCMIWHCLPCC